MAASVSNRSLFERNSTNRPFSRRVFGLATRRLSRCRVTRFSTRRGQTKSQSFASKPTAKASPASYPKGLLMFDAELFVPHSQRRTNARHNRCPGSPGSALQMERRLLPLPVPRLWRNASPVAPGSTRAITSPPAFVARRTSTTSICSWRSATTLGTTDSPSSKFGDVPHRRPSSTPVFVNDPRQLVSSLRGLGSIDDDR